MLQNGADPFYSESNIRYLEKRWLIIRKGDWNYQNMIYRRKKKGLSSKVCKSRKMRLFQILCKLKI